MTRKDLDRLRQEQARSEWLSMMLAQAAERCIAKLARLQGTEPAIREPKKCWMVRRAGLTAEQSARVDRLGIPEPEPPSRFLPNGVVAVVFTETLDGSFLGRRVGLTLVRDEAVAPPSAGTPGGWAP